MPAQTTPYPNVVHYGQGDTAPALRVQLVDGDGSPIDLSGSTVVINIAYSTWSFYYAPFKAIVVDGPCVVDPDQSTYPGYVEWRPQVGDLDIAGTFSYTFTVTYPDATTMTFPQDTYGKIIVRARVPRNLS